MNSSTKTTMICGIIFLTLMLCLSYLVVGEGRSQVSFTYTAPVTQKTVSTGDTTEFSSTLTNTGSGGDTYDVDMIEKPPTPVDWWMQFCSGGVCWDSSITNVQVTLNPSESDEILLKLLPRSSANGKVTMRITSQTNPSLKDSITFTLNAVGGVPVLNRWALIALTILISGSTVYLLLRRLKLSKIT